MATPKTPEPKTPETPETTGGNGTSMDPLIAGLKFEEDASGDPIATQCKNVDRGFKKQVEFIDTDGGTVVTRWYRPNGNGGYSCSIRWANEKLVLNGKNKTFTLPSIEAVRKFYAEQGPEILHRGGLNEALRQARAKMTPRGIALKRK
jgi:hypothetical protein